MKESENQQQATGKIGVIQISLFTMRVVIVLETLTASAGCFDG